MTIFYNEFIRHGYRLGLQSQGTDKLERNITIT